jgi:hypothetical protein
MSYKTLYLELFIAIPILYAFQLCKWNRKLHLNRLVLVTKMHNVQKVWCFFRNVEKQNIDELRKTINAIRF